jgi:hypothetical protein
MMTMENHDMTRSEEEGFFDAVERFNKTSSALKIIAWALGAMAVAGLGVAGWVWGVNAIQSEHIEDFADIKPRVAALETRAVRFDAAPPPSQAQFFDIDKRLDRMEQNAITLREQNAMILESLKKLESRP